jgi:hypothetical protein
LRPDTGSISSKLPVLLISSSLLLSSSYFVDPAMGWSFFDNRPTFFDIPDFKIKQIWSLIFPQSMASKTVLRGGAHLYLIIVNAQAQAHASSHFNVIFYRPEFDRANRRSYLIFDRCGIKIHRHSPIARSVGALLQGSGSSRKAIFGKVASIRLRLAVDIHKYSPPPCRALSSICASVNSRQLSKPNNSCDTVTTSIWN